MGGFDDNVGIEPFEFGIWFYPLLITNFIILALGLLHFKNKLPHFITESLKFLFNFEISSKVAFLVIIVLIGVYITTSVSELFNGDFLPDYGLRAKAELENYDVTTIGEGRFDRHLGYFLTTSSMHIFGNYKVIPFISSISLLVLTYFVTFEISKKRFAGIVAFVILLQSNIFLFYDTTVVYPNYWIVFFLLSIYLVYKKWPLSPILFILAMTSKGLSAMFFPTTLFFIFRAKITKQQKIRLTISYGIIVLLGVIIVFLIGINLAPDEVPFTGFKSHDFWGGFSAMNSALRTDGLVLLFILPLIVGLFLVSRNGFKQADSIMVFILTNLLLLPFLVGFSDHHNVPYRLIPLIVFFAIGVGVLLSKRIN